MSLRIHDTDPWYCSRHCPHFIVSFLIDRQPAYRRSFCHIESTQHLRVKATCATLGVHNDTATIMFASAVPGTVVSFKLRKPDIFIALDLPGFLVHTARALSLGSDGTRNKDTKNKMTLL